LLRISSTDDSELSHRSGAKLRAPKTKTLATLARVFDQKLLRGNFFLPGADELTT